MKVMMKVGLSRQPFIPTGVEMMGLWSCPHGPADCFDPAEKEARSFACPDSKEHWGQRTGGTP